MGENPDMHTCKSEPNELWPCHVPQYQTTCRCRTFA